MTEQSGLIGEQFKLDGQGTVDINGILRAPAIGIPQAPMPPAKQPAAVPADTPTWTVYYTAAGISVPLSGPADLIAVEVAERGLLAEPPATQ